MKLYLKKLKVLKICVFRCHTFIKLVYYFKNKNNKIDLNIFLPFNISCITLIKESTHDKKKTLKY